jgi:16S rRNA processing protein RimM
VGKIIRPHGVRGEVNIYPLTDWPEKFVNLNSFYLESREGKGKWVDVDNLRLRENRIIAKFSGIDDRNAAEVIRGFLLKIRKEECHPLPKDTYYIFDLIGLLVKTDKGEELGKITDVIRMPAQDVYIVDVGGRETMIPAVKEYIKKVDIAAGEIIVKIIDGLID